VTEQPQSTLPARATSLRSRTQELRRRVDRAGIRHLISHRDR
jgi:hypothetical protein